MGDGGQFALVVLQTIILGIELCLLLPGHFIVSSMIDNRSLQEFFLNNILIGKSICQLSGFQLPLLRSRMLNVSNDTTGL